MKTSFGPYTIHSKIAEGGMAEVLLATKHGAESWQQEVVVKRILPHYADHQEFRRLFFQEAHLATRLKHANLVRVDDFLEVDDEFIIIEEYLAGKDLQQVARQAGGHLSWQLVAYITYEVLKALNYLHSKKPAILHRDISPQNVMLTYDGQVKLLDMGIAEIDQGAQSGTAEIRGKRRYLPPEYLQGASYSKSSELYSLGMMMRDITAMAPLELKTIFNKATAADVDERYTDAESMRRDLTALLTAQQLAATTMQASLQQEMQQLYPLESDRQHAPLEATHVLKQQPVKHRHAVWHGLSLMFGGALLTLVIIGWPLKITKLPTPQHLVTQLADASAGPIFHRPAPGTLNVDSYPWSSVYLNGKFLGITPLKEMEVPSGDYQLYLVTRDGRSIEMPLQIESGKARQLFQQIP